jgi:beta-glucosidase
VVESGTVERTACGWEVAPQGLTSLLKRIHDDYRPGALYITENGSSYEDIVGEDGEIDDPERRDYLRRHLAATREALAQGLPVKGYFAWSLLDNFEWAQGYTRRFGLSHVDFASQQRRLKQSSKWYRQFLRED